MEFQDRETYFYEQTTHRKSPKRYKKLPEELPQDLRFAHLNPRVAAYLASKEKEKADEIEDGLGSKSLLPQINQTVSLIRQRLDSLLSTDSDGQRALFEQAKQASDGILMQLAEILYLFEGLHIPIPKSLEHALLNGWKDLIANASHTQRDWQNPSSKDAWENRKRAHSVMSDRSSRPGSVAGGRASVVPETTPREGDEDKGKDGDGGSKRSRSKGASRTGHLVGIVEDEELDATEGASKKTHDGGTSTVPKRRESHIIPKTKSRAGHGFQHTHLQTGHRPGSARMSVAGRRRDDASVMESVMSESTRSVLGTTREAGYYAVIQFQLSSKACEDKGWIIHPGGDDMDGDALYEWAVQRLSGVLKAKHEQDQLDAENGCDMPVVLRFYGDKRKEELQKYKRTGSGHGEGSRKVGRGKLPRVPPMEPKLDPNKPVLLTTISDGSSTVFYQSGRPAVVISRSQMGKPGFYTLVFDNTPEQKMLASFCPSGRGCCYHSNGVARFIATETGGTMSDETGAITKRWDWPVGGPQAKLPIPIIVQLNHNLSFRCLNQYQMQVFFQCHKEQTKFNVGVTTGAEEPPLREEMGKLMTGYIFTSKAAKEFSKPYRLKPSKKGKSSKSKLAMHSGINTPWGSFSDSNLSSPSSEKGSSLLRGASGLAHNVGTMKVVAGVLHRNASFPAASPGGPNSSSSSPGLVATSAPSTMLMAAMKHSATKTSAPAMSNADVESGASTPKSVKFANSKINPLASVLTEKSFVSAKGTGSIADDSEIVTKSGIKTGVTEPSMNRCMDLPKTQGAFFTRLAKSSKSKLTLQCNISEKVNSHSSKSSAKGPITSKSESAKHSILTSNDNNLENYTETSTGVMGDMETVLQSSNKVLSSLGKSALSEQADSLLLGRADSPVCYNEHSDHNAPGHTTPPTASSVWPRTTKHMKGLSSIADLQKSLEIKELTENDAEADTVLIKLQRKAKNLVDGWQEHYRMALSITSPDLWTVKDQPKKGRYINSAKSSPGGGGLVIIEPISTQVPRANVSNRVPSAPVGRVTEEPSPSSSPVPGVEHQEATIPAVKFDENPPEEFEAAEQMSVTASTPFPASLFSRSLGSPGPRAIRMKSAPQRLATTPTITETLTPATGLCPGTLRMSYLGEERIQCRCSRHKLPYITDIEYDEFINNQAPEKQMIIVVVVSTLFPESTPAETMLESLYSEKNRNRTRPCLQSRQDAYRILLYDVATASDYSDHSQPLLLRQHNVVPGMFLMYEGGQLLFCDHIFNGYGNARKDFQKQIMETRRMADQGYCLPKDFRFSPQKGRHGPRSAWGGQIGGAGVDRHAGAGVCMEQQLVKRSSVSSLCSSESDSSYNKHLHLSGLDKSTCFNLKMFSAPIHQVLMAERASAEGKGAPLTSRTERSITLPVVSKPNQMYSLGVK